MSFQIKYTEKVRDKMLVESVLPYLLYSICVFSMALNGEVSNK